MLFTYTKPADFAATNHIKPLSLCLVILSLIALILFLPLFLFQFYIPHII